MAKGTRVTQQEKEQMWQLYNQLGSYAKVAKKLHAALTPFPAMCANMKPL